MRMEMSLIASKLQSDLLLGGFHENDNYWVLLTNLAANNGNYTNIWRQIWH